MLARFRHQHFLMFLIAHFQRAALLMFSDRLVGAVSRLDITNAKANRIFRRDIRNAHENFLRFAHRYWFHHISHQAQVHELFDKTRGHLQLDNLYAEVREELQDMGSFLDVEAMRKQNETVVRLTVVTTFGLVGTVTTGFIGMNLFDWTGQPTWWKVLAFFSVFVPMAALTLYTVLKSRRLSDFLDSLSDESVTWGRRWRALTVAVMSFASCPSMILAWEVATMRTNISSTPSSSRLSWSGPCQFDTRFDQCVADRLGGHDGRFVLGDARFLVGDLAGEAVDGVGQDAGQHGLLRRGDLLFAQRDDARFRSRILRRCVSIARFCTSTTGASVTMASVELR